MMIRIPAAQAAKCESMYDSLSVDDPVAVDGRFVVNNLGEETVTGIMKSGEFPAYVTRLGRKAFYKTKVVSMSQKTEALKVRLLFSAPNNVEIDISKNYANQFLYPWVNSGSPGGALDRSCVEARLTPEELGETNVAAAPPPLPTSAAAVNTIAAEYDVVYDPSHECSDSQEAWTKVLRDYVPQYDPKV
ncbi:MAG: hypothetical protein NTY61_02950, partial [Candidatus Parcubacteria bacterium]|nr:hypothetical protein [Candidatus Parcubacteria bacterium]